ncbi:MAG: alpha-L-fucosidase [Planctomycetes bacterium]|nr:alpha-L-fucosidase [Planctomycetota bacterium]
MTITLPVLGLSIAALSADAPDPGRAPDAAREWFEDAKFGLFVHWGVYSLLGRGEWVMQNEKIPVAEYEKLPPKFNPTGFDPAEWVSIVKRAGQRYITITSKHHDGFCMWGTKQTKYNIADGTPYGKDVLQMLSDECRRQGIKLFFYHSHLDWHHPDYYPRGSTGQHAGRPDSGDWHRYLDHMDKQLEELCSPPYEAAGIWFDGWWDKLDADWRLARTYSTIHRLRPQALIGNNHHVAPFPGEDFQMFEQDLPGHNTAGFNTAGVSRMPLETCRTMNNSWGYSKGDKGYRPLAQQIRYLVDAVGLGSNLLLNVGPTPEGKIPPEAVEILLGMGRWLEENGEAIYGTRQGPWAPSKLGYALRKGRRAYFHLVEWPEGGALVLPKVEGLARAALLRGGKPLDVAMDAGAIRIAVPESARDPVDTIIALDFDRDLPPGPVAVPPQRVPVAGDAVTLVASQGEASGRIRLEGPPKEAFGFWTDAKDSVAWRIEAAEAGEYDISITFACDKGSGGSEVEVACGESRARAKVHETGDWASFVTVPVGLLRVPKGPAEITVRALSKPGSAAGVMNLRSLVLERGFVSLFDGKTLEGWKGAVDGYGVEGGAIFAKPTSGGNLYTAREYADFTLRLEIRLERRSNNGIGIRTPEKGDAAYVGMEIQVLDDPTYEKEIQPWQRHGSAYGIVPAEPGHLRPTGEWNVEEITAKGRRLTVRLNGAVIVDDDLDRALEELKRKDEKLWKSHIEGARREKGRICFCGHGARVDFRNIRLKDLAEGK